MEQEYERLILRHLSGTATPEEASALSIWRLSDPENEKTYYDYERIFSVRDTEIIPSFDTAEEWTRLRHLLQLEGTVQTERMLYVYLKIAASVALAVVSFFVVRQLINELPEQITSGEVPIEIFLEDSSRVWLNKNSSVEYDYGNKERSIKLQGEAFFEVKPDRLRPFTISADKSRIVVVGTSFMVHADPLKDINSVEVHEGVVEFSRRGNTSTPIRLTKNMRGLLDKNTGQLIKSSIPGDNITAILDRKIVFRATNMEEVIRVLMEYFDITITVTNPEILTCRFTSTFDDPTIQEVFEVLSVSLNLEVVTHGDKFSLQGGGCK